MTVGRHFEIFITRTTWGKPPRWNPQFRLTFYLLFREMEGRCGGILGVRSNRTKHWVLPSSALEIDRGRGTCGCDRRKAAIELFLWRIPPSHFCRFVLSWLQPLTGASISKHIMKRTASAVWHGDLKQGKGTLSAPGGALNNTPYSFTSRFENGPGTNPEELIAAAHAGCFTMALSAALGRAGFTPTELFTRATLSLEQVNGNWTITTIQLELTGRVPGIDAAKFEEIAKDAKANCPVSRVLKAEISLSTQFLGN